jgi:CRISPR-associated protein Csd1
LNAPISEYASFAYVTALNHLIEDKKHCNIIGDTTVVYWAENADEKLQDWLSSFGFEGGFHDSDHLLKSIMRKISQGYGICGTQNPFSYFRDCAQRGKSFHQILSI